MKRTIKEQMEDLMQAEDIYKKLTRKAMKAALEYAMVAIMERAEQRERVLDNGREIWEQASETRSDRMYMRRYRLWGKNIEDHTIVSMLSKMMNEL